MKLGNLLLKKQLKDLWQDERGQSTTEYILMLSVVVMIAIKFKNTFAKQIDSITGKLSSDINDNINSGSGN